MKLFNWRKLVRPDDLAPEATSYFGDLLDVIAECAINLSGMTRSARHPRIFFRCVDNGSTHLYPISPLQCVASSSIRGETEAPIGLLNTGLKQAWSLGGNLLLPSSEVLAGPLLH